MPRRTPENVEPAWIRRVNCLCICGSLPILLIGALWQPWLMVGILPVVMAASHRADITDGRHGLGCALRELVRSWKQPPMK